MIEHLELLFAIVGFHAVASRLVQRVIDRFQRIENQYAPRCSR